jgi:hypothetical protein
VPRTLQLPLRLAQAGLRGRNDLDSGALHAPCRLMNDNAPPAGWVVQVTTPGRPSPPLPGSRFSELVGPPSFRYFNVAIAAAEAAIAATTKHLADPQHPETSVVRALSLGEIAALGLSVGDVKPA